MKPLGDPIYYLKSNKSIWPGRRSSFDDDLLDIYADFDYEGLLIGRLMFGLRPPAPTTTPIRWFE